MGRILKRAAAVVTGVALAASTVVATELPAGATPSCSATFTTYRSIKAGSTGTQAKAMECLLSEAGFATTVNGSFSVADGKQLAKFRSSVGLSPLEVGGARAWSALLAHGGKPTLKVGDTGQDVLRLQLSLRSAGFTTPSTASFDSATAVAVKAAQKNRKQTQTGIVGDALWRALQGGRILAGTTTTPAKTTAASAKKTTQKATKKKAKKSKGAKALAFAKKQLGDPYRYGARGPNAWDCSGLTGGAWKAAGVKLPRTSQAQYRVGKKVSKSKLKPGDLVFFYSGITHVAIYAGNGKVIHASRPGKPVSYIKMKYMPFKGARRPA